MACLLAAVSPCKLSCWLIALLSTGALIVSEAVAGQRSGINGNVRVPLDKPCRKSGIQTETKPKSVFAESCILRSAQLTVEDRTLGSAESTEQK